MGYFLEGSKSGGLRIQPSIGQPCAPVYGICSRVPSLSWLNSFSLASVNCCISPPFFVVHEKISAGRLGLPINRLRQLALLSAEKSRTCTSPGVSVVGWVFLPVS